MANVNDYVRWRGDLSFVQSSLNEVDALMLVFISYLNFDNIVPNSIDEGSIPLNEAVALEFAQHESSKPYYGAIMPNEDMFKMAKLMSRSNRFSKVRMTAFYKEISEDSEEQFNACTMLLDDGSIYVSYKGTDDTLVGWKEDLNLSFVEEIPGQRRAVEYLNYIGERTEGKIRIGGHSKGGNLAVYAAARCNPEVRDRIVRIYNNDGPGFHESFLESDGYKAVKSRVLKLVPQESVIGMLLGHDDNYTVVRSGGTGVFQHNSYLWEVRGRHFIRYGAMKQRNLVLSRVVNKWIEGKDIDTRRAISDALYEILTASDAKTLTDLARDRALLLRALVKVEPKKRETVFHAMLELMGEIIKASVAKNEEEIKTDNGGTKDEKIGN